MFEDWRAIMICEGKVQETAVYHLGFSSNSNQDAREKAVTLESVIGSREIVQRIDLGLTRIPVNQIAGIVSGSEDCCGFSRLRCREFLGKFYICGSSKQISLLQTSGAMMTTACVTRLIPAYSEEKEIKAYYEFLSYYPLLEMYQIQFTQPGFFEKFQNALGHDVDYVWTPADRSRFLMNWYVIESAFYNAFDRKINITPADALVVILENHTFSQIKTMPAWLLSRVFQASWRKLHALSIQKLSKTEQPVHGKLQTAS